MFDAYKASVKDNPGKTSNKFEKMARKTKVQTASGGKLMPLDESLKVLSLIDENGDIPEKLKVDYEELKARYIDYYVRNDPEEGGSEYIRAKISNAKDALCVEFGFNPNIEVPEKEVESKEAGDKKGESKTSSGNDKKEKGEDINL